MASSVNILTSELYDTHLRPVDTRRDLAAVADVIEICFRETLDPDGQNYLKRLRDAARFSYFSSWASALAEDASVLPISGYVWVEEGQVVGNLSLIPFNSLGKRCYLIANVAVLPEFRGRGIGTRLTARALEHVRDHRGASAWLQVRQDNPTAVHIYQSLGFIERTRRTSWVNTLPIPDRYPGGYLLNPRRPKYWDQQRTWLHRMYPAEFAWHLPVNWRALQPGWRGDFYRFISLNYPKQWGVTDGGTLCGIITWMNRAGFSDYLLLAAPEQADPQAIQALLIQVRKNLMPRRRLSLNTPANFVAEAIQAAGFSDQQTLIWMEVAI